MEFNASLRLLRSPCRLAPPGQSLERPKFNLAHFFATISRHTSLILHFCHKYPVRDTRPPGAALSGAYWEQGAGWWGGWRWYCVGWAADWQRHAAVAHAEGVILLPRGINMTFPLGGNRLRTLPTPPLSVPLSRCPILTAISFCWPFHCFAVVVFLGELKLKTANFIIKIHSLVLGTLNRSTRVFWSHLLLSRLHAIPLLLRIYLSLFLFL